MAPELLLYAIIELVSYTALQGAFFGVSLSIYFLCTQLFYARYCKAPPDERRKIVFLFSYNSLMVSMAALELATQTRFMQLGYIDHGGVQGELTFQEEWENNYSAFWLLAILPYFVIGTLGPLMQVWRTWIIWASSPYRFVVTILPLLLEIAGLLMVAVALAILSEAYANPSLVQALAEGIALAGVDVAFDVSVTLLLVGRIIVMRRRHAHLVGTTSESAIKYTSIIAMLTESYALAAAWSIARTISYALAIGGSTVPLYPIFNDSGDQVEVIAFLLVTYRVLLEQAWTSETGRQLSTMQWNHDSTENSAGRTVSIDRTVEGCV